MVAKLEGSGCDWHLPLHEQIRLVAMTSYITSHGKDMRLMSFAFFFWLLSDSKPLCRTKSKTWKEKRNTIIIIIIKCACGCLCLTWPVSLLWRRITLVIGQSKRSFSYGVVYAIVRASVLYDRQAYCYERRSTCAYLWGTFNWRKAFRRERNLRQRFRV